MEIRLKKYCLSLAAPSNPFTTVKEVIEEVKRFYSATQSGEEARERRGIGAEIVDDEGGRVAVALSPAHSDLLFKAISKIEERLPVLAIYIALKKELGMEDKNRFMEMLASSVPAISSVTPQGIIEEIVKRGGNVEEYVGDVLSSEKVEETIDLMKVFDDIKEEVLSRYNALRRGKKDREALQGAILSVLEERDLERTNELEEILQEARDSFIASSVMMTEGAKKLGMKIKSEAGKVRVSGDVSLTRIVSMMPSIKKVMNAKSRGEQLRAVVEDLLGLKYLQTVGIYKEGSVAYPVYAILICGNGDCDAIAVVSMGDTKTWTDTVQQLL